MFPLHRMLAIPEAELQSGPFGDFRSLNIAKLPPEIMKVVHTTDLMLYSMFSTIVIELPTFSFGNPITQRLQVLTSIGRRRPNIGFGSVQLQMPKISPLLSIGDPSRSQQSTPDCPQRISRELEAQTPEGTHEASIQPAPWQRMRGRTPLGS